MEHVPIENRNGLVAQAKVNQASGKGERGAAVDPVDALGGSRRRTLGADKTYDIQGIVREMRACFLWVVPC